MLSTMKDRRERGMTVAMLAVFIVGLFGMAALAIDLGILYTARTSAQHAADAAALAGAATFVFNPTATQPDAAQEAAVATAGANYVLGKQVTITTADVNVDIPARLVTVTVPLTGGSGIATYFARVFSLQGAGGMASVDVIVQASAEAAETGAGSRCLKPIFIPNTILSALGQAACNEPDLTQRQVMFVQPNGCNNPVDPNDAMVSEKSQWYESNAVLGGQYIIKPSNPQNALEPSQFYGLDFGAGANDYKCTLGYCTTDCGITDIPACGDAYPVKTGKMQGPTIQGINDLTGPTPDVFIGIGQYDSPAGSGPPYYDTSNQVVVAPVWDNCCQVINPGTNGQTAMIVGFVDLFIDGQQGGDVQSHLLGATPCAGLGGVGGGPGGGGAPPPQVSGPLGKPIRLVQTPVTP